MSEEFVKLPFGAAMYTDKKPIVLKKPGCPDIEVPEYYSNHKIIGKRFVNVQYHYMKFKCKDETGEEWGSAWDTFCIDLLNFTTHNGYAHKLSGFYCIQDNNPTMLTIDDSLIVYPKITSKKPMVFEPELPIMDDGNPFIKVDKGIFCIKYLNFNGEFAWVILFSPSHQRRWKRRVWKTTQLNDLVIQFKNKLKSQAAV